MRLTLASCCEGIWEFPVPWVWLGCQTADLAGCGSGRVVDVKGFCCVLRLCGAGEDGRLMAGREGICLIILLW